MHKWRTEEQGILVGRNTVTVDDCELTARLWQGKNPERMVIDKSLSLPVDRKYLITRQLRLCLTNCNQKRIAQIISFKLILEKM